MLIYKLEIKRPGNFRWKSHDNFLSLKKTKGQFMYGQELSLCFQRDQDIYIRIFNLPRSFSFFLSDFSYDAFSIFSDSFLSFLHGVWVFE